MTIRAREGMAVNDRLGVGKNDGGWKEQEEPEMGESC